MGNISAIWQHRLHIPPTKVPLKQKKTAISTISSVGIDGMNTNELDSVLTDGANCGYCQKDKSHTKEHTFRKTGGLD